MSKNKPMADNEMENAAGGQIEERILKYTDLDGKTKTRKVYDVFTDDHLRTKLGGDIYSLDAAQQLAEGAGVSTKITGVHKRDRQGFSEEELSAFES